MTAKQRGKWSRQTKWSMTEPEHIEGIKMGVNV